MNATQRNYLKERLEGLAYQAIKIWTDKFRNKPTTRELIEEGLLANKLKFVSKQKFIEVMNNNNCYNIYPEHFIDGGTGSIDNFYNKKYSDDVKRNVFIQKQIDRIQSKLQSTLDKAMLDDQPLKSIDDFEKFIQEFNK